MDTIRILVADDHALLRDGIRSLLSAYDDMDVIGEALDGKDAIEKAKELAPDLVIMDIAMPVMDGMQATRHITKQLPGVKVLMLTQHDNKEYKAMCQEIGAAGFVPKRALAKELVSAIRAVQEGHSYLYTLLQVQE